MKKPLAVLMVLAVVAAGIFGFASGCGDGNTIIMGSLRGNRSSSGTGDDDASTFGPDPCGASLCANHHGSHDFYEASASADQATLFDAAPHEPGTEVTKEPAIVYPSHETMFPINVSRIRHEWTGGAGNDLYRLRFVGSNTTVNVFTTDLAWTPSEEEWDWIAESNRGTSVTLTVSALDTSAAADIWQSEPITLYFSDAQVEGAIYYWSTGTQGVMRALVSDPVPVKFYTDPAGTDATCVACHTLSRDGKRLAVGYGAEKLWEVSVPERQRILPAVPGMERASAWTTFSPDGKMLLVAANGKLTLIDSDTGDPIGPNAGAVPIPSGTVATHPDWSSRGDRVALTLGTAGGNKEVDGGSIAVMTYEAGVWGDPQILVASQSAEDNNFFPVWSPDSHYIAYVNAVGKSKDAVTATLRLISADGGTPIAMPRLNERVNNVNGITGIGNSMPTWAPSTKPGVFWIAFSSLRANASLRPQDEKEDQIWIAAIDPTLPDPGYAAFWAPFQNIDDGNHRAFWTHTEEDTQCACQEQCGDAIDNDCDGTADESDCVICQPTEICDNGLDDDCDCVVDDCITENCTDGIDNDGDGLVDSADPLCSVR